MVNNNTTKMFAVVSTKYAGPGQAKQLLPTTVIALCAKYSSVPDTNVAFSTVGLVGEPYAARDPQNARIPYRRFHPSDRKTGVKIQSRDKNRHRRHPPAAFFVPITHLSNIDATEVVLTQQHPQHENLNTRPTGHSNSGTNITTSSLHRQDNTRALDFTRE